MRVSTKIKKSHKLTPLKFVHENKSYSLFNRKLAKE